MLEFDTRKKAKDLAEFITPLKLREFIASKVKGDNLNILDISVGSGQLLFCLKDRINHLIGYDVNTEALNTAKLNFKEQITIYNEDYILASDIKSDICISNYPFSLKPTKEQKEAILSHSFLKTFFVGKKDVTGLLDFIFILKSFNNVKEAFYLCFPGIAYRKNELNFRKYLIENNYIACYGMLNNCKFTHTSIPILYLHLKKEPTLNPKRFLLDFDTKEYLEDKADFSDFTFNNLRKEQEKEIIDPLALEIQIRALEEKHIKDSFKRACFIWGLDEDIRNSNIIHPNIWIDNIFKNITKDFK